MTIALSYRPIAGRRQLQALDISIGHEVDRGKGGRLSADVPPARISALIGIRPFAANWSRDFGRPVGPFWTPPARLCRRAVSAYDRSEQIDADGFPFGM